MSSNDPLSLDVSFPLGRRDTPSIGDNNLSERSSNDEPATTTHKPRGLVMTNSRAQRSAHRASRHHRRPTQHRNNKTNVQTVDNLKSGSALDRSELTSRRGLVNSSVS